MILVVFATTSNSLTLSVTGFRLMVIPISTGFTYVITITKKISCETFMKKLIKDNKFVRKLNKLIPFRKFSMEIACKILN